MTISKIILIPLIVGVFVQIIKLLPEALKGNLNTREVLLNYGGMPSGHAAIVVSVTTMVALLEGTASPLFAWSIIFSIIIMRDSIGFRQILGLQSKAINKIVPKVFSSEEKIPKIQERLGHSWLEVIVGALVGLVITLLLNNWF